MSSYDDIIHLPHHVSRNHRPMSMSDRAAQFMPFAALTGYDAKIRESSRLTEERMDLDENEQDELNMKLQTLKERLAYGPIAEIAYFQEDERKEGGRYLTNRNEVKKIEDLEHRLIMKDGTAINFEDMIHIEICEFEDN
ncbi:MAG: hypothetical protein EOM64_00380 [Erysipelotrichia bacterium]|nr:hypothetical protein [Erysipelotrichia bacterium]